MKTGLTEIDHLPSVHRIENCSKDEMTSLAMEMTHAVYSHDQVYGQYCSIQYIRQLPAGEGLRVPG